MGINVRRRVTACANIAPKGQRPAVAGPDVRVNPTLTIHRLLSVKQDLFYSKRNATHIQYLPLKQRQPKRASGATMLMLSGALTSPSHCKEAAPCDSHGSALPRVFAIPPFHASLHIWQVSWEKPTASYLLTLKSVL